MQKQRPVGDFAEIQVRNGLRWLGPEWRQWEVVEFAPSLDYIEITNLLFHLHWNCAFPVPITVPHLEKS